MIYLTEERQKHKKEGVNREERDRFIQNAREEEGTGKALQRSPRRPPRAGGSACDLILFFSFDSPVLSKYVGFHQLDDDQ